MKKLLPIMLLFVFGCEASVEDSLSKYEHKTDVALYNEAKSLAKSGNTKQSAEAFAALRAFHPESNLVKKSLTDTLKMHMLNGQYDEAKEIADKIIDWYPGSNIADEAYYFKGMAILGTHRTWLQKKLDVPAYDLNATRLIEAKNCFTSVVNDYPHSRFVPQAKKQLRAINSYLAKHELHIAKYYQSHGNMSAAKARIQTAHLIDPSAKELR